MKYFEFGQEHSELMVILHGGGVSYLGMLPTAKKLAERYHVVLVAYDGFNPGEPETEFVSPMDEARRLGDYVVEHYGGKIDILYGISYGCRVLMEVLADKRLTVTTTIADGMGLRDYPNIKSKWGKEVIDKDNMVLRSKITVAHTNRIIAVLCKRVYHRICQIQTGRYPR